MRFRWHKRAGVAIGLAVGLGIVAATSHVRSTKVASGPVLSECDGHFRELVLQYEPSAREVVARTYRDFLGALEADVTVRVVCPTRAAYTSFLETAGPVRCRLLPIVAGHAMTTWSRDRWVALGPATNGGPTTLWSPRGESADEIWPARAGDERIGQDIAAAMYPAVFARRSDYYFDGGDFLADSENVFVVSRVLPRNIQQTVFSREVFLAALGRELRRHVILLDESPDHHAGMFMASVGGKIMLVGDPGLGGQFTPADAAANAGSGTNEFMDLPGGPDFSAETRHRFDAVAAQCAGAGYRVVRIPVVPARDQKTYLTYVNVLMDRQGSRRIVYLPFYRGCERLNAAGRAVWEKLGFEVRPVDCTDTYRHYGCLHCLVNVLERG